MIQNEQGNDFRLGAMEAPPAVMSMYLGASMTEYLEDYMNGKTGEHFLHFILKFPWIYIMEWSFM